MVLRGRGEKGPLPTTRGERQLATVRCSYILGGRAYSPLAYHLKQDEAVRISVSRGIVASIEDVGGDAPLCRSSSSSPKHA
jgi:hypothetical protein